MKQSSVLDSDFEESTIKDNHVNVVENENQDLLRQNHNLRIKFENLKEQFSRLSNVNEKIAEIRETLKNTQEELYKTIKERDDYKDRLNIALKTINDLQDDIKNKGDNENPKHLNY